MRRLVFTLMILLLPLRGWAGDAMAMQMALPGGMPHGAAAGQSHGSDHHPAAAQADHRQAVHAAETGDCTDPATDDAAAMDTECQTCTMCQACHNMAITLPPLALPGTDPLNSLPPLAVQRFASADRALGLKPPISRLR